MNSVEELALINIKHQTIIIIIIIITRISRPLNYDAIAYH